ncbi:VanZ family protein [Xanthomonadaceae bacterium XH05]|nr:VanZ family protein [Xanthomonadaceae bacterium XH05]
MRELRWSRFWFGMWMFAILAVIVLSLIPPPPMPMETPRHFDKLLHVSAYFVLAFGAVQVFERPRVLVLVACGLVALGMALEWAQATFVPHLRMLDLRDALANAVGVLLGMATAATSLAGVVAWLERRIVDHI